MSITGKSAAEMMAGISVKPTAAELRASREREAQAERALLAVGTIWRANGTPFHDPHYVKVVQCSEKIGIRRVLANGRLHEKGGLLRYARRDRFGGTKRGNYAFVRAE